MSRTVRKIVLPLAALVVTVTAAVLWMRRGDDEIHYTGFVEGEERVLRSEVAGRVLEVRFEEGDEVPANVPVAVLDDRDVATRLEAKRRERDVLDAEMETQEERIRRLEETWARSLAARRAEVRSAEAAATHARRNLERERALVETGASTRQLLDDAETRATEAASRLDQARETHARTEAEGRDVEVARATLAAMGARRELLEAQIDELEVARSKTVIQSPPTATRVQTRFLWPGELAQPGSAILEVIDPRDKYVQVYVPVADAARLHVGRRVAIEIDGMPGVRTPGEISFISDEASFTPEKIETRADRLGQVYRVKVRILERVEEFRPGTEGNVYLVSDEADDGAARASTGETE